MSFCDVSIVMLAHNGVDFTRHALTSILQAKTLPWEIFLVDNASEDDTPNLIRDFTPRLEKAGIRVHTWRNSENLGCSLARNQAWEKATSKYTIFMDNDVAVCTSDWLARLITIFDQRPNLGILGPKMIYPYRPHPIQCAGVSINRMGRVAFRGRGADRHDPRYQQFWLTWALISATWLMKTDLRDSVGMLDELFHPVQYEDLDLCVRTRLAGFEVAYTPEVEMYHFEGITTASFGQEEYKVNIARNSLKFRERYHQLFKTFTEELPAEEYRWLKRQELGLRPELDLTQTV
ncbi:MAG TPA: glycosyltransferase family 2 protein [Lentisphaeria bacterium]|nr:glycosyltransferase family 2 protein [Lentisphaeria bacterium]